MEHRDVSCPTSKTLPLLSLCPPPIFKKPSASRKHTPFAKAYLFAQAPLAFTTISHQSLSFGKTGLEDLYPFHLLYLCARFCMLSQIQKSH